MNKIYLGWEEIGLMIEQLANKVHKSGDIFDGIYGIPKGGLPIATAMAYKLGLPMLMYPTINTLVVDDISDTGRTLASHKNKMIATLFTTDWTITKPDYYVTHKIKKTDWIVYPWELDDAD